MCKSPTHLTTENKKKEFKTFTLGAEMRRSELSNKLRDLQLRRISHLIKEKELCVGQVVKSDVKNFYANVMLFFLPLLIALNRSYHSLAFRSKELQRFIRINWVE